jgi:anaerobic ribonucleoside-triphosphate reductase activating protein
MLKYVDTAIVFSEVPDEITLAINISGCPCACRGCHSAYLADDVGTPLSASVLKALVTDSDGGVSCVAFMGGDGDPGEVNRLCKELKRWRPALKTAWYSGRAHLSGEIETALFNYIKLGPYMEEFGPLGSPTTNQRFYEVIDGKLTENKYRFT